MTNSAIQRLVRHRKLRSASLKRYWDLKNAEQADHVPTGREHVWGWRFAKRYPKRCANCACETRSPFDATMIIHDVDACQSANRGIHSNS